MIKDWEDVIAVNLTGVFNVTNGVAAGAACRQGADRQHRLDPILRACAHAKLAGLYRLEHGVLTKAPRC